MKLIQSLRAVALRWSSRRFRRRHNCPATVARFVPIAISADGATSCPAVLTPPPSAGRWRADRPSRCCASTPSAVNAVAFLKDGRAATAGADGRIALWTQASQQPDEVLEGHTAPVVALAVSPDGATLASASWDQHGAAVAARRRQRRACSKDIRKTSTASHSCPTANRWSAPATTSTVAHLATARHGRAALVTLPAPLNTVAVAPDGEIVSGRRRRQGSFPVSRTGEARGEVQAAHDAHHRARDFADGRCVAAAGIARYGGP